MRPLRLEIEGFASFRERTVIDFEGADLFVLSGPMGAGKSSIIDAMAFALYGSVSRFDNPRLVAPAISQGLNQTRVRLDFVLDGREYAAVRVVRRTPSGSATTAEARLLDGAEVVAGTPDELTEKIGELVGLNFEQFTKCVVLPQGEFSELLHARASERQDLLVRLLDIGFYRNIGTRARERHANADTSVKFLQSRLENDLRNATEAAYKAAETLVHGLEKLDRRFAAEEETLQTVRQRADAARSTAAAASERVTLLRAIEMPEGTGDLGARVKQALEGLTQQRDAMQTLRDKYEALQEARKELGERSAVEGVIAVHDELARLQEQIARAEKGLEASRATVETAAEDLKAAQEQAETAEAERDRLARADSAYHAARNLKAGDVCPICGEVLTAAPKLAEPAGTKEADAALDKAKRAVRAFTTAHDEARTDLTKREAVLNQLRERVQQLDGQITGQPTREDCALLLTELDRADAEIKAVTQAGREQREKVTAAEAMLTAAQEEEQKAWSRFHAARDPVAADGAPSQSPEGIEASWLALQAWAVEAASKQEAVASTAVAEEQAAREEEQETLRQQAAACAEAGIVLNGARPRDALLAAKGRAEQDLRYIDEKVAERAGVEQELASCSETLRVAGTLAEHLRANRFERWYLREALNRLVAGASKRLQDLSNNQYSIALNAGGTDFVVVDHINADEERPVRTLSGGETFLASLALALALGDDIASLATKGAARLDALFLDEGFGTLDADTLETVTSTIEELGARGRMVGIVTHVRELAERIPVQYHVHKERGSSRVERVEAH